MSLSFVVGYVFYFLPVSSSSIFEYNTLNVSHADVTFGLGGFVLVGGGLLGLIP